MPDPSDVRQDRMGRLEALESRNPQFLFTYCCGCGYDKHGRYLSSKNRWVLRHATSNWVQRGISVECAVVRYKTTERSQCIPRVWRNSSRYWRNVHARRFAPIVILLHRTTTRPPRPDREPTKSQYLDPIPNRHRRGIELTRGIACINVVESNGHKTFDILTYQSPECV